MRYISLNGINGNKPLIPFSYDVMSSDTHMLADITAITIVNSLIHHRMYGLLRLANNIERYDKVSNLSCLKVDTSLFLYNEDTHIFAYGVTYYNVKIKIAIPKSIITWYALELLNHV